MRQHLGASGPDAVDVEQLKIDREELRQRCEALERENAELKEKVSVDISKFSN